MERGKYQIDLELDQETARKVQVIAQSKGCSVEEFLLNYLTQYVESYPGNPEKGAGAPVPSA